jgi:hypothetical protein
MRMTGRDPWTLARRTSASRGPALRALSTCRGKDGRMNRGYERVEQAEGKGKGLASDQGTQQGCRRAK